MSHTLPGWKMVRADSGGEVLPGTMQLDFRGDEYIVNGVSRAPAGNSTGRVTFNRADGGYGGECYPAVFGLKIIPETQTPEEYRLEEGIPEFPEIPDTPAELIGATGKRYVRASLRPGGPGLQQIREEFAAATIMNLPEALAEVIVKAYALGHADAKAGREPPFEVIPVEQAD